MRLKLFSAALTLLFTATVLHAAPVATTTTAPQLQWEKLATMTLPAAPLDVARTADGKRVFLLTSNNEILLLDQNGKHKGTIDVAPGVSAIEIDPDGEFLFLTNAQTNNLSIIGVEMFTAIDTEGSPFKGNENAPATLVVFTDFECPYCGNLAPFLEQVFEQNPQTVKIVLKNMPLSFHKMAEPAARAALAAGEQGQFWEFHDALFKAEKVTQKKIDEIAEQLKLDKKRFLADMESQKIKDAVQKDLKDAEIAEVTGTPTVFLNGKKIELKNLNKIQNKINIEVQKARAKQ